jgi:DNA (cytosine-5)-methyltransferase 1
MSTKKKFKIKPQLKFIDLCCGIGGFHQALTKLNMKCVLASDIDEDCRKVYETNYGITPEGDLHKINISTIPSFDVLCAGFPCQPFSKAGKQSGFEDDRGNIFFEICKIIKHHNPKYLILENVRNLHTHDDGNTWSVIKQRIDQLNYYTYEEPLILNTLYFGVPQSRERVVILCKRKDLGILPTAPIINKKILIKPTSLSSIIESELTSTKYNINGKMKVAEEVWDEFLNILKTNDITVPKFPIWTDWWDSDGENTTVTRLTKNKTKEENDVIIKKKQSDFYKKYTDWIEKNREFYKKYFDILNPWIIKSRNKTEWLGAVRKMEWQTGEDNLTMKDVLWSPRGSGIRIKKTNYSPTLVAMASMIPFYGPLSRELTPRECARLQSFPDEFIIHENDKVAYKQFGNAVNVIMIEQCARFLIKGDDLFY